MFPLNYDCGFSLNRNCSHSFYKRKHNITLKYCLMTNSKHLSNELIDCFDHKLHICTFALSMLCYMLKSKRFNETDSYLHKKWKAV